MTANRQETEIARLQEENSHLRGLLAGREQTQEVLATERKVAVQTRELVDNRERLEQQARLFDTLLSSIVDFAYTFDRAGCFTYVNQALLDLWQIPLADALGKSFFDLPYPHDLAARLQQQIETVFTTGQILRDETPYTGATGTTRYYEYILVPIFAPYGQVEIVAGSTRDITQRVQAQAENEALLKTLAVERTWLTDMFMQAPTFITVLRGPQHIFEMANPPYYQLVGQRDLIGKTVREAFPDVEGQGFFEILDAVYQTKQPFIGKDMHILFQAEADLPPQEYYVEFVFQPLIEADGSVSGIFAHGVDLTERKRAEEALRESGERFRFMAESMPQKIFTAKPNGEVDYFNAQWTAFTGLSFEQIKDWGWTQFIHPDDVAENVRRWQRSIDTGDPFEFAHRFRRADGEYHWHLSRAHALRDAEGKVILWIGSNTDIDDQKRVEEKLRERQEHIEELNVRLQRAMTETHHRVKNNLQHISALIEMQKSTDQGMVPMSELARLGTSVRALAVIHDILTQEAKAGSEQETLSAKTLLENLLALLQQTVGANRFAFTCEDAQLVGRQATSLALVTNELVSNALKHGKQSTNICFRVNNHKATLEVCDDGPGFPDGFDAETEAHTGLELVEQVIRWDLQGTSTYENRAEGGARITVSFPIVHY